MSISSPAHGQHSSGEASDNEHAPHRSPSAAPRHCRVRDCTRCLVEFEQFCNSPIWGDLLEAECTHSLGRHTTASDHTPAPCPTKRPQHVAGKSKRRDKGKAPLVVVQSDDDNSSAVGPNESVSSPPSPTRQSSRRNGRAVLSPKVASSSKLLVPKMETTSKAAQPSDARLSSKISTLTQAATTSVLRKSRGGQSSKCRHGNEIYLSDVLPRENHPPSRRPQRRLR